MLQFNCGVPADSCGGFCEHVTTCYWGNCAGGGKTAVIDNDKHYAACRKDRWTGVALAVREYRVSRHEGLSCCYLISIPYCIYITPYLHSVLSDFIILQRFKTN
jgi:hypothetical protein